MTHAQELDWHDGFASLGPGFFTELRPTPLAFPYLVSANVRMAELLGIDFAWLSSPEGVNAFTGNEVLPRSRPLATVYSGHQFGVWAGQLGDGRAILLGDLPSADGRQEIQLKGAGATPYSRMGDGRAVLRSSIREYLCSEAMHGLGIPTTRALCVTGSDQPVRREEMETAAVVARVAPSFVRFGHFEHFFANGKTDQLKALADFVIDRFYPECRSSDRFGGNVYAAFLAAVADRTAAMVAQWQAVGFCHGVMNTDNMSILGLTIDYGPFQFLDAFDPNHICNHSDEQGRYAFNRQPNVAYWNLFCLGQALLSLIGDQDVAIAALDPYKTVFPRELEGRMKAKLGLTGEQEGDRQLVEDVLTLLAKHRTDFTIFWRRLSHFVGGAPSETVRDLFIDAGDFDAWLLRYEARLPADRGSISQAMLRANPKFVLRNHLAEVAIRKAKTKDFSEVDRLLVVLQAPFEEHPEHEDLAGFPPEWASAIEISCSS